MTTEEILIVAGIVVAVLVLLGVAFWIVSARRRKRQNRLRDRYGREYDATVDAKGRRAGVDDLDHREEERRSLHLRDPGDALREELRQRMAHAQFRFVEEPHEVLLETQRAVVDGLRARGYPIVEDRERALRLLSVDHPEETPSLRELLSGDYGRDTGRMRELFADARRAMVDVLGVSYTYRDLALDGEASGVAAGHDATRGEPPHGEHLRDDPRLDEEATPGEPFPEERFRDERVDDRRDDRRDGPLRGEGAERWGREGGDAARVPPPRPAPERRS